MSTATTASLEPSAIEAAMTRLADQDVEGIVLAVPLINPSAAIDELTRRIPTVTTDGSRTETAEIVAVDQEEVGRLATRHLLELGHESVWHIAGPQEWNDAAARAAGWRSTLISAGIAPPPLLRGDWSPASGYDNGLILGRIPEATAVFVASDEMAFGVIRALGELGRRVPHDISVVGVDDITLAEFCSPPLTTVAQPFAEMGALAVDHLLRYIAAPDTVPPAATVEARLVVRASTAAPRR